MSWHSNWDPSFDLSRGGIELSFRVPDDMNQLLIRTETTQFVDKIINNLGSSHISPRYHVIGTRGFGKSTILNYIAFRLLTELKSEKLLPIYASLSGSAENENDLDFVFFKSLLESLFDAPWDIQKFHAEKEFSVAIAQLNQAKIEYRAQLKQFGKVSLEYVTNALENQLEHLRENFYKIIFLIDGLDKQKSEIVLKFFRNKQEKLSNLITKYGLVFFYSADPDWRETLSTKEFSGVRGVLINLRGWTYDEVRALVKNRLDSMNIYQMPFDSKAIEVLVEDFQGNPREILQYSTTLLHFARAEGTAIIGSGLARKVVWKDTSKDRFYKHIIVNSDAQYAFEKLKAIYPERQMMNILLAVYNQRTGRLSRNLDYEERSSVGITLTDENYKKYIESLLNTGCLTGKIQNYVELHEDIAKLFDFVISMNESLLSLFVVVNSLESKISDLNKPKAEQVIFKDEVKRVFEQHPSKWLNYSECKEMLLADPRTRGKLEEHFKQDFEKKITQILPLVINDLLNDGKLINDTQLSIWRWRSFFINNETADFFKSKSILDLIENAKQAAADLKFAEVVPICQKIIDDALSKLCGLFDAKIDVKNRERLFDFLINLELDIYKPVSLSSLLNMLKEPISNVDEANLYVQTSVLYARRIFGKYQHWSSFEPKNLEIANKIISCKTGNSRMNERKYFNDNLMVLLKMKYGRLVSAMSIIKSNDGVLQDLHPDLNQLVVKKLLLPAVLYQCPICKHKTLVSLNENDSIQCVNCVTDGVPLVEIGKAYNPTRQLYQAWNVWMEEYTRDLLDLLPCKCLDTGVMLKPLDLTGITNPEEIDLSIVYRGLSIAIECTDTVTINEQKNDVLDLIQKIQTLGLFQHIILVYGKTSNAHAFGGELRKYEKLITPILIGEPVKFKKALLEALSTAEEKNKILARSNISL